MTIINGGLINCGGAASSSSSTNALSDGLACFTGSFSGVTTTSISHNLNSSALVVEFKDSLGNLLIPDTWSITNPNVIEAEFSPAATGDVTIVACIESGFAPITGGVTSVEGLSGVIDLDSPNGSILITTSGQVINLNAIFTPASGAVLEQKCRDIDILSGLIDAGGGGGGGVSTINGISGTITLTSTNNGLEVGVNGQSIEFTSLFTYTSGQIIDQHSQDLLTLSGLILSDGGQTSVEGVSGVIDLEGLDGTMVITVDGQTIQLSGLYNPTSGLIIDQHSIDLLTLSGLIGTGGGSDAGQTSINGLSGALTLTSPDGTILIGDGPQAIHLSGLFTAASGATLQQKCEDVLTLSGTITQNTADINGVDTRLISLSGLTDGLPRTQTSLDGLSGVLLLDSPDGTILIGQDGQTIELSGLFTQASGAVLEQHTTDLVTLSGLIGAGGGGGGTSINGISGTINLVSPDESVGIAVNGQNIELTVDTSGACSVHTFTPSDGTLFTVTHGLNTEDFVWNMWRTDADPNITTIGNVASSGLNHAIVQLAAPISGKLVIQGCASSGTRADIIATKTITDHYTTSTIDSAIFADASSADITVTLHNPSGFNGKSMYVKMIATSGTAVTLNANGSGLIDNDNTAEIDQIYHAVRVTAHDGNWWIL
tara:strand:+ start:3801 stop:5768 length:1968 start_codon:yes stop_codon:yes gene_type:complete